MDMYADDLRDLIDALDLKGASLVGHSAGGGEVARYIGRHGTSRVARAVLVGAVTPLMLKTAANPGGLPIEVFDTIRAGVAADRSQFFKDLTTPFFGANRPGAKVSQGVRDAFWFRGMQGGLKNQLDCIEAFSETDFTEDLKKFDVPTLIIHGDDDQIVPIGASAHASSKLVKNATLKVYPGGSHGLADTHKDQLNADLVAFLKDLRPPLRLRNTGRASNRRDCLLDAHARACSRRAVQRAIAGPTRPGRRVLRGSAGDPRPSARGQAAVRCVGIRSRASARRRSACHRS